jgi:RNA polymerase sigma-70 factor, ECF subfamily
LRPRTPEDVIASDAALEALAAEPERKARVVELRFFAGLSVQETTEVLQVSEETVTRDWRFAKSWLLRELSRTGGRRDGVQRGRGCQLPTPRSQATEST